MHGRVDLGVERRGPFAVLPIPDPISVYGGL